MKSDSSTKHERKKDKPQTRTDNAIEISIIIPTRNRTELVASLLASIDNSRPESVTYEVIVVDDASVEQLQPLCERYGARYVALAEQRGPAYARNIGAQQALGDILFFLDSDVVIPAGLLERVQVCFSSDPELGAVSFFSQRYCANDNAVRNYAAAYEHYSLSKMFPVEDSCGKVRGIATRNGAIRRYAFEAIGGFDPNFTTNAMEDLDFSIRLAAQFKTVMLREPLIYHHFPESLIRLLRNYAVRTALFIPYYLEHKPQLFGNHISGYEAGFRLAGCGGLLCLALAGLWQSAASSLVWGASGLLLVYLLSLSRLSAAFARWSRSPKFLVKALGIHTICTMSICLGGAWGVYSVFRANKKTTALTNLIHCTNCDDSLPAERGHDD